MDENRKEFVRQCGELLRQAKPHLVKCELVLCYDKEEFVEVTAQNGAMYHICVEANSLAAIALDIFKAMAHK